MGADEKSTAEQWVGRTIAGKYRVEELLGKGGMGLVVRARHVRLEEDVAIKILLPAMLEVPGMVTRFVREARAASKIKSSHVVRVTDVDVLEDGVPYMVMEYLEGISLAALRRREGRFEIADAVRYVLDACDAIAEAHSLGIVHRDLKPANLFVARTRDGGSIVKVLDFGISKVDAPGEQDTTKTGQMMGSPKFMAPEQMLSMHDVDGRADIWSLGAILYDLVTGRTPFVADTVPQLCSAVLTDKPPPARNFRPDIPEELEAVLVRCLQRERGSRFPDVGALAAALAPFVPMGETTGPLRRMPAPLATRAEKASEDEAKTVPSVPGATRPGPHSVTPPEGRAATISVWNATTPPTSNSKRNTRIVAAVVALAAIGAGGLAYRNWTETPSPDLAGQAAPTVVAQAAPSTQPSQDPVPASATPPAQDASASAPPPAATTAAPATHPAPNNNRRVVPPRGGGAPPKEGGGGDKDPFGGNRH
jgi:serine/threonine-protein kinase